MTVLAQQRLAVQEGGRRWRRKRAIPVVAEAVMAGYVHEAGGMRNRLLLLILLGATAFIYGLVFALSGTYVLMQLLAPFVVMAGLIIWLLPDTGRAPVRLLDRLLMTFVAVVIIWPNYLALALPGMPWITMIRLVAVPLAIVMLICLSTSKRFRSEMAEVLAAAPILWKLLAGFTFIAFLSVGMSRDMGTSLNKLIVAQLYWTLIFFSACYALSKPGRARAFVYVLWIGMLVVAVIGVQEWRHQVLPWAGHIPSFLKVEDELLSKLLGSAARKGSGIYRVKSVFTTPLGLAEYLALSTPFLIHLVVTAKRLGFRLAAAGSIVLAFYVIGKTDSRLGAVGFFASFLLYLLAWGAMRWRNQPDGVAGRVIVLTYPAVFCAFIAASFFVRRLEVMVWGSGAQQASSEARKAQIAKGVPQIFSHPWGYGMGQGADTLSFANQAGVLSIDSYYLLIGLEYGVLGFLIYYGMLAAAVVIGGRYALDAKSDETKFLVPIVISLIVFMVIKSVFAQEGNHPVVFAMLGAVVALVYRVRQEQQGAMPHAIRLRPRSKASRG